MAVVLGIFLAKLISIWAIPAVLLGWWTKDYRLAVVVGLVAAVVGEAMLQSMQHSRVFSVLPPLLAVIAVSLWFCLGAWLGRRRGRAQHS